jgi:sulfoacetaldehyde dehydrogenase
LLRDLQGARSTGHIHDDIEKGLSVYYRPKGVIAAIVPSTNPLATPVNNIINALKTGNAIIIAPSPKGVKPGVKLLGYIHAHLRKLGLPDDLVQMVPSPPSKAKTERLMQIADLVVVTGSQNNVRAGYRSGTPAIGVGAGNVVTIIDETADISGAAEKIAASKTFDNATSCSSENSVIAISSVYEDVCQRLQEQGGLILTEEEGVRLRDTHWHHGKMTGKLLAKDIEVMVKELGLEGRADADTRFLVLPQDDIDKESPLTSEKMSRFLTLYRADDFEDATRKAVEIQSVLGAGHSLGVHTSEDSRAHALAMQAQSCRIIVNQAHCFATGGFFNNGMPFSLSMGCGSWGKNSIDENLNWTHFVNKVNVVRVIPENKPELADMFSSYWEKYGK